MPRILLSLNNPFSGHWRLRWHLQDGNMNEIIRNGVTSMESGARKAPFMGSQYCLLNNPRPGLLTGHWSDLESWYSELYRASLFKERRSGLDTRLVVFTCSPIACMEEAAISVCPLVTHMSDLTLNSSHQTGGMWQIIQCVDYFAHLKKLKCWGDKWPCLRNRQQSGWLSRHRQGANRCWQLSTKDGPRSLRSTFSILLWSGWFQNLVYTYNNDLLNLLTFTHNVYGATF